MGNITNQQYLMIQCYLLKSVKRKLKSPHIKKHQFTALDVENHSANLSSIIMKPLPTGTTVHIESSVYDFFHKFSSFSSSDVCVCIV